MKLFFAKLCALAAATQVAVSSTTVYASSHHRHHHRHHHSVAKICGTDEVDSLASSLNGTSVCFNSHKRAAPVHHHGKAAYTTTDNSVYQQFTDMNVDARKCSVKFTSDPYLDGTKPGMAGMGTQYSEFSWRTYVNESKKAKDVYTGVRVLNKVHGYNWINSRLDIKPTGKIDYCIRNVEMACNAGATNWQFGELAIEFTQTFWEYTIGINGVGWENCGLDNAGIRPKQFQVFTLTIAPFAMTGTTNNFLGTSSSTAGDGSNLPNPHPTCYTRYSQDVVGEKDIPAC